jgi:hypothetical protein
VSAFCCCLLPAVWCLLSGVLSPLALLAFADGSEVRTIDRQTDRQTDRLTDKKRGRQIDRQIDRLTDRQGEDPPSGAREHSGCSLTLRLLHHRSHLRQAHRSPSLPSSIREHSECPSAQVGPSLLTLLGCSLDTPLLAALCLPLALTASLFLGPLVAYVLERPAPALWLKDVKEHNNLRSLRNLFVVSPVCCLLSAVCCLLSAVCSLVSGVCCLQSGVGCLLSAVLKPCSVRA